MWMCVWSEETDCMEKVIKKTYVCACMFVCLCEEKPERAFRGTDGRISTQWELMLYFSFAAIHLRGGLRYSYFRCSFAS